METLGHIWTIVSLLCVTYCFLHLVLPHRIVHPLRLEVVCREEGCTWAKIYKDRSAGDKLPMALNEKIMADHKKHYQTLHPEKEWEVRAS